MGLFKNVVYGTGIIMVAEPVAKVLTSGIETVGKMATDERKAFNDGYVQGWKDAQRLIKRQGDHND